MTGAMYEDKKLARFLSSSQAHEKYNTDWGGEGDSSSYIVFSCICYDYEEPVLPRIRICISTIG